MNKICEYCEKQVLLYSGNVLDDDTLIRECAAVETLSVGEMVLPHTDVSLIIGGPAMAGGAHKVKKDSLNKVAQ